MQPVRSFDVFDTLIARRCVEPRRVVDALEQRVGLPGLAQARLAADRTLGGSGRPYKLADIWRETARTTGIDARTMEKLLTLEVDLEHEQVIPVAENLALVRHGDLLVSDTYLPADIVLSLLRKAGLTQEVGLVVTNAGKYTGRIWPLLLSRLLIREHLGDNPHSDGQTPTAAGVRSVLTTLTKPTPVEQALAQRGWEPLAHLAREVRLANPFTTQQPQQRTLWNLTCQLNFPLLYLASLWLERGARQVGAGELLFVSRDGWLWRTLFARLCPHRKATYLYGSRLCLLKPSDDYLAYFRSVWHPGALVVDLFSTGASWTRLFARLGQRGRCRFIGWIDDHAYLSGGPAARDWLDVEVVFRTSAPGPAMSKGVEMLNYAPHGLVEDVQVLPGGGVLPVLAQELEYPVAFPEAAQAAFTACVAALEHHPDLLRPRLEPAQELIRALVGQICAEPSLPAIYAGHDAADRVYHQRLLS